MAWRNDGLQHATSWRTHDHSTRNQHPRRHRLRQQYAHLSAPRASADSMTTRTPMSQAHEELDLWTTFHQTPTQENHDLWLAACVVERLEGRLGYDSFASLLEVAQQLLTKATPT